MKYRKMGRTGLKVSALCLGVMTFGWSTETDEAHRILDAAVAAGINFIDTADIYSRWIPGNVGGESETILGGWLKGRPRHEVIIATKVKGRMGTGVNDEGLSRVHIIQACEDSLRRLGTEYIDLYQAHSPDPDTRLEETLEAFSTLVQQGKVRYIGASNYTASLLMKTLWVSDKNALARFDCLQPHYSLLHRKEYERELEFVCTDQGVGVIPYSPLAAGFLTGKYTREQRSPDSTRLASGLIKRLQEDDAAYAVLDTVKAIAAAHEVPMAQVALAWLLARPGMTAPIIGVRTLAQLNELVGAAEVNLSADEISILDDASGQLLS